jgi:hypothetical protein
MIYRKNYHNFHNYPNYHNYHNYHDPLIKLVFLFQPQFAKMVQLVDIFAKPMVCLLRELIQVNKT